MSTRWTIPRGCAQYVDPNVTIDDLNREFAAALADHKPWRLVMVTHEQRLARKRELRRLKRENKGEQQ